MHNLRSYLRNLQVATSDQVQHISVSLARSSKLLLSEINPLASVLRPKAIETHCICRYTPRQAFWTFLFAEFDKAIYCVSIIITLIRWPSCITCHSHKDDVCKICSARMKASLENTHQQGFLQRHQSRQIRLPPIRGGL